MMRMLLFVVHYFICVKLITIYRYTCRKDCSLDDKGSFMKNRGLIDLGSKAISILFANVY